MRRFTEGCHDPPHCELGRSVLRTAWTVKKCGPGADEDQRGVFLSQGRFSAILLDEVVHGDLRCVQDADKVNLDNASIRFLRRIFYEM